MNENDRQTNKCEIDLLLLSVILCGTIILSTWLPFSFSIDRLDSSIAYVYGLNFAGNMHLAARYTKSIFICLRTHDTTIPKTPIGSGR